MIDRKLIQILSTQYKDSVRLAQERLEGIQNLCKHPEVQACTDQLQRPAQTCIDCGKIIWSHREIDNDTIWIN